jgi:hypothetical protein
MDLRTEDWKKKKKSSNGEGAWWRELDKGESAGGKNGRALRSKPPFPLSSDLYVTGVLSGVHVPRALTAGNLFLADGRAPPRPRRPRHRKRAIITAKNRESCGRRSRLPAHAAHYAHGRGA